MKKFLSSLVMTILLSSCALEVEKITENVVEVEKIRENVGKFETVLQHRKNQTAVNNSNSNRIQESNPVRFFKNENFNLLYI